MMSMADSASFARRLSSLVLPGGGLPYYGGGGASAEPGLLALLAFSASGLPEGDAKGLLAWISARQNADGSLGLDPAHPGQGLWLTAPSAVVFHRYGLASARDRALDFLIGLKSAVQANDPRLRQDNTIVGWPWVPGTFGWVEPTAWSVVALNVCGRAGHARAVEGRRFLLDRQIPSGGWNYGNPGLNDRELLPFWDTTGLALLALAGQPEAGRVAPSLELLEKYQDRIESPCGLAWAVLGLESHGRNAGRLKERLLAVLASPLEEGTNAAHYAAGVIALAGPKVFLP